LGLSVLIIGCDQLLRFSVVIICDQLRRLPG